MATRQTLRSFKQEKRKISNKRDLTNEISPLYLNHNATINVSRSNVQTVLNFMSNTTVANNTVTTIIVIKKKKKKKKKRITRLLNIFISI